MSFVDANSWSKLLLLFDANFEKCTKTFFVTKPKTTFKKNNKVSFFASKLHLKIRKTIKNNINVLITWTKIVNVWKVGKCPT